MSSTLVLWVALSLPTTHPAPGAVEAACHDYVQGRIAWNREGDRRWNRSNLEHLCLGTRRAREPGVCFEALMQGRVNWGGGNDWQWENALALCRGTSDAQATIQCFRNAVARDRDWPAAIEYCSEPVGVTAFREERLPASACRDWVQGRIAWNYRGNRVWEERYLDRLCRDSRYPEEPGRCFERVMHGGVDWGGGTRWEPDNALALCAGSENADATVGCFRDAIHRGIGWNQAIGRCSR